MMGVIFATRVVAIAALFAYILLMKKSFKLLNSFPITTTITDAPLRVGSPSSLNAKTVAVAGVVRNNKEYLKAIMKTIMRETQGFHLTRLVFFENDSIDDSLEALHKWNQSGSPFAHKVDVITDSEKTNPNLGRGRTQNIAYGMNQIWQHLQKVDALETIDYLFYLDMDEVAENVQNTKSCLDLPSDWAVCCANQRTLYYDLWALRTYDNWTDCDVWKWGDCKPHFGDTNKKNVLLRQRHIPPSADPISVRSCFGGAVLMDFPKLKQAVLPDLNPYWGGTEMGEEQIHHPWFNYKVVDYGWKVYIQPKMLNDAPIQHIPVTAQERIIKELYELTVGKEFDTPIWQIPEAVRAEMLNHYYTKFIKSRSSSNLLYQKVWYEDEGLIQEIEEMVPEV